jgi:hypothetical protein
LASSPELNPDEYLNQDLKTNAVGRTRPLDRKEMIGNRCIESVEEDAAQERQWKTRQRRQAFVK